MNEIEIRSGEVYDRAQKQFGEEAQRVTKEEYFVAVDEIARLVNGKFDDVMSIIPLDDKESFGDIDLVVIWDRPQEESGDDYLREILGDRLIAHRHLKNDKMDSVLLRLDSGKIVQADFARTKDEVEFTSKIIHSSKGHSSSVIGTLAMAYGYKFAQDGFYKRYFDKQGQYHDILVTQDLMLGMEMLGLDPNKWIDANNVDDIVSFIAASPFFESKFYERKTMKNKRRAAIEKRGVQNYMYSELEKCNGAENKVDHKTFLEENFSDYVSGVNKRIEEINQDLKAIDINGDDVMAVFGIEPSKLVGEILLFIKKNHPDTKVIDSEVKQSVLKVFEL